MKIVAQDGEMVFLSANTYSMNFKTKGVSIMICTVKKISISVLGVDFHSRFRNRKANFQIKFH